MPVLLGLVNGFLHVLTGPDHIAAIAPYSVDGRRAAWRTGLSWGVGHSSGVILVAVLSLLLRELLPLERLSGVSERLVGVVLIGIGLWAMRAAVSGRVHAHRHRHGDSEHTHMHVHGPETDPSQPHTHTHAAFAVGTLHGFAGSSHLLGVLPAVVQPSRAAAAVYLISFGAGTVAAMTVAGWAMGTLLGRGQDSGRMHRVVMGLCSLAALGVGGVWLIMGGF